MVKVKFTKEYLNMLSETERAALLENDEGDEAAATDTTTTDETPF